VTIARRNAIHTSPEPIRVLHLTDPHLFADAESSLRGTITHSSLSQVLAHITDEQWPADLVVVTGDLIQDDSKEAYEQFRQLMTPLGLPVFCVPGNHDARELMRAAVSLDPFHYCASVRVNNWLITGIDSCLDGKADGQIDARELVRLAGILDDTSAEHVMVCLHHPPMSVGSRWLDQVGLQNSEQFLTLIAEPGKVRAALFGHVHQPFEGEHDSIRIIGTPSTCRQFTVGSDEFALDDNPPAYRKICLHADGSIENELIWVDACPVTPDGD
jgi:Icc protein